MVRESGLVDESRCRGSSTALIKWMQGRLEVWSRQIVVKRAERNEDMRNDVFKFIACAQGSTREVSLSTHEKNLKRLTCSTDISVRSTGQRRV